MIILSKVVEIARSSVGDGGNAAAKDLVRAALDLVLRASSSSPSRVAPSVEPIGTRLTAHIADAPLAATQRWVRHPDELPSRYASDRSVRAAVVDLFNRVESASEDVVRAVRPNCFLRFHGVTEYFTNLMLILIDYYFDDDGDRSARKTSLQRCGWRWRTNAR